MTPKTSATADFVPIKRALRTKQINAFRDQLGLHGKPPLSTNQMIRKRQKLQTWHVRQQTPARWRCKTRLVRLLTVLLADVILQPVLGAKKELVRDADVKKQQ